MKNNTLLILALLLSLNALGQKIDKFNHSLYRGKYSNKDFFNKAEYIFEGEVIKTEQYFNEDRTKPFSSSIIKVIHVFKGDLNVDTVEFVRNGGKWWVRTDSVSREFYSYDDGGFLHLRHKMIFFAKKRERRTFRDNIKVKLEPFTNRKYAAMCYSEDSDYNFDLYGLKDLYFKDIDEFQKYAKRKMRNKRKFKEKKVSQKMDIPKKRHIFH